jgi:hypothetical protein
MLLENGGVVIHGFAYVREMLDGFDVALGEFVTIANA